MSCEFCGAPQDELLFRYEQPPEGETRFDLGGGPYRRELRRCPRCAHVRSLHDLDLSVLYEGAYMDSTYAGEALRASYERIMALPTERSDNAGRVARVLAQAGGEGSLLDVGSGLGVFCARMSAAGWRCTALDPDPRSVEHARTTVHVEAIEGDFLQASDLGRYDLVTFNKVLEHVQDPVAMLRRAHGVLQSGGMVYVELPDGELAAAAGPQREELFIEHFHAFSAASACLLASAAGFVVSRCERLREPSDKLTLFAFLVPAP